MMQDLSLHILDLCENSLAAGARLVTVVVEQRPGEDRLTVSVRDDGRGMTAEQLRRVCDPFYTTRTTRPVGLGVPMFRLAAELTGGSFSISSQPGRGTEVRAEFVPSHIDCLPLGDMAATMCTLISGSPGVDFVYTRLYDDRRFELDTRRMRGILGAVPLNTPEVLDWVGGFVRENEAHAAGRGKGEQSL